MTQSKQEVATRKARIRAEKLRENLARRKQQTRQRVTESQAEKAIASDLGEDNAQDITNKNSIG